MAKESGLGDNLYLSGRNVSGDIGSLGSISGGPALLEVTGIDKSAVERLGGHRSGQVEFNAFWNTATDQIHDWAKTLPTSDRHVMYVRGAVVGNPAAGMVCKQINYDPTRGADGSLTSTVTCLSNGFGLEWGRMLTAGIRTDSGATNGASIDTTASLSFGVQAYLQVFSFSGTSVTITVEDSANDSTFAAISGLGAFATVTSAPATERLASTNAVTVRRYLRVSTTGTFSSCAFAVMVVKNEIAGQLF